MSSQLKSSAQSMYPQTNDSLSSIGATSLLGLNSAASLTSSQNPAPSPIMQAFNYSVSYMTPAINQSSVALTKFKKLIVSNLTLLSSLAIGTVVFTAANSLALYDSQQEEGIKSSLNKNTQSAKEKAIGSFWDEAVQKTFSFNSKVLSLAKASWHTTPYYKFRVSEPPFYDKRQLDRPRLPGSPQYAPVAIQSINYTSTCMDKNGCIIEINDPTKGAILYDLKSYDNSPLTFSLKQSPDYEIDASSLNASNRLPTDASGKIKTLKAVEAADATQSYQFRIINKKTNDVKIIDYRLSSGQSDAFSFGSLFLSGFFSLSAFLAFTLWSNHKTQNLAYLSDKKLDAIKSPDSSAVLLGCKKLFSGETDETSSSRSLVPYLLDSHQGVSKIIDIFYNCTNPNPSKTDDLLQAMSYALSFIDKTFLPYKRSIQKRLLVRHLFEYSALENIDEFKKIQEFIVANKLNYQELLGVNKSALPLSYLNTIEPQDGSEKIINLPESSKKSHNNHNWLVLILKGNAYSHEERFNYLVNNCALPYKSQDVALCTLLTFETDITTLKPVIESLLNTVLNGYTAKELKFFLDYTVPEQAFIIEPAALDPLKIIYEKKALEESLLNSHALDAPNLPLRAGHKSKI